MDVEAKGERAEEILKSDVYQDAARGAEQRIKDRWAITASATEREQLWHKLQAIRALDNELVIIRDRGVMERKHREKERG